jgi:putative transcriptional regulator
MGTIEIPALRKALGLSQVEFGQLLGVHFMTVSKWERGLVSPSSYQLALMDQFARTAAAKQEEAKEQVKNILVAAGVIAALLWLLSGAAGK